ncbi:hypothetical protein SBRCBS47491_001107 [Sporothrix bragantina]|uniref:Xylanolytic transcriptional activator regulatory domain-containing protein n=1 Tax=Sporothrix bragantina TaxID=671064 RepID=A0ABP0AVX3_9PEZI
MSIGSVIKSIDSNGPEISVTEYQKPLPIEQEREEPSQEEPSRATSPLWDQDFQDFWMPDAWLVDQGFGPFDGGLAIPSVVQGDDVSSFAHVGDICSPPPASLPFSTPSPDNIRTVSTKDAPPQQTLLNPLHPLDCFEAGPPLQHVGLSGEMDPYVLRHLAFNSDGTYDFGQYRCRQVVDATMADHPVPVQFLGKSSSAAPGNMDTNLRTELDAVISPEMGTRLLGLFLRYVFPSLPVLSRSFLDMDSETLIPQVTALAKVPTYLLAAAYATSTPFLRYDPVLCVSSLSSNIDSITDTLWVMVYDTIRQRLLTGGSPSLAVLQTTLIYLQKPMVDNRPAHVDDNSANWFLVAAAVQLAFKMGLHMDCRAWPGLPPWEKRLRRRLWWVVYSETIFRSLLTGNANPIHDDQWDVTVLDDADFVIDGICIPSEETANRPLALQEPCRFCHAGYDFLFIASLARIAHQVFDAFYTYRATRRLANDFAASLSQAAPLLRLLQEWKRSLPRPRQQMRPEPIFDPERHDYFHSRSSAQLKLTFLTLHVLIYRGLLRPLSSCQSSNVGEEKPAGADAALKNAAELIKHTLAFVQRLGAFDCNGLFYSWSCTCFSTISSFLLLLLLVQHPTSPTIARELAAVMARWPSTMRQQSALFKQLRLGLYRLDTFLLAGLETTFNFPETVRQALSDEFQPSSSYSQSFPRRSVP